MVFLEFLFNYIVQMFKNCFWSSGSSSWKKDLLWHVNPFIRHKIIYIRIRFKKDHVFNFEQKKSRFHFFVFLASPLCHAQLRHEQDPHQHHLPPLQTNGLQTECTSCEEWCNRSQSLSIPACFLVVGMIPLHETWKKNLANFKTWNWIIYYFLVLWAPFPEL